MAHVREAARKDKKLRFTALLHHVTVDLLRDSFFALKRGAAPGVDGVTWQNMEASWKSGSQTYMVAFIVELIERLP